MIVKTSSMSARAVSTRATKANVTATTWEMWTQNMKKSNRPAVAAPPLPGVDVASEMASLMKKTIASYQPKFVATSSADVTPTFTLVEDFKGVSLPTDLHRRLETVGALQLKSILGLDSGAHLDAATTSFTTSDIAAALSVTGTLIESNGDRSALVCLVATEAERQASWSRLEGLIMHWACTEKEGSAWNMPPSGWVAVPNKSADAGGAIQCKFNKQAGPSNESLYVLVLQLPLSGILKSGGVTFVLKASEGQNTRWLKNEKTDRDFFIDLHKLPAFKP